ncbi:MAG: DUF4157 domain-containing protein [Candidatus Promineifilaceae bacterium]
MIDLLNDISMWPKNMLRDFGRRAGRILAALELAPQIRGRSNFVYWIQALLWYFFDFIGGPELVQFFLRAATETRKLTFDEIERSEAVLGRGAVRFQDVRIATGGVLTRFFGMNKNRAFATWHTVNLPQSKFDDVSLLVHELTHVLQYERIGSVYITEGLSVQRRHGRRAYSYGGSEGLRRSHAAGKKLRDYNREQQGQIAQDYTALVTKNQDTDAYRPFIDDLQKGLI